MAYCVKCGVKLEDGAKSCPLCDTKVILPNTMEEKPEKPLFKKDEVENSEKGLSKGKKGILEVTLIVLIVAEIVIGAVMLPSFEAILPMVCVLYAAMTFLYPILVSKPSFVKIMGFEAFVSCVLVALINLLITRGHFSTWSLLTIICIGFCSLCSIIPIVFKKKPWVIFLLLGLLVNLFLFLINILVEPVSWYLTLALPIFGVFVVQLGIVFLRLKSKKIFLKATAVDMVVSSLAIVCLTVAFGDFASLNYLSISWSGPLWICGVLLGLIEILISTVKRIRVFFNSANQQL